MSAASARRTVSERITDGARSGRDERAHVDDRDRLVARDLPEVAARRGGAARVGREPEDVLGLRREVVTLDHERWLRGRVDAAPHEAPAALDFDQRDVPEVGD